MANDLSSNPMVFDTAAAGTVVWPYNMKIHHFEYSGYGTQGNLAILKNKNGKIVCQMTGADDLEEVRSGNIGWIEGLIVDTLQGNGIVLAYLSP